MFIDALKYYYNQNTTVIYSLMKTQGKVFLHCKWLEWYQFPKIQYLNDYN